VDETEVADELYGVPPQDFIRVRDERADEARAAGNRELSASIKRLRRPTMSAWALNTLVRRRPEEIEDLLSLGGRLRDAQVRHQGAELRELDRQRKQLLAQLSREVHELAAEAGQRLSDAAEAEVLQTLHTALVDPAAAHTVRSGRMSAPLSYSGLGPLGAVAPETSPVAVVTQHPTARRRALAAVAAPEEAPPVPDNPPEVARPVARRRVEEDRRLREQDRARTALADAEHDVEEAAIALRDAETRLQRATSRREDLEARIQRVTEQLHELEEHAMHANRDVREARHARDFAAKLARAAQGVLERARHEVDRLGW
jgi:hypothetical protein